MIIELTLEEAKKIFEKHFNINLQSVTVEPRKKEWEAVCQGEIVAKFSKPTLHIILEGKE